MNWRDGLLMLLGYGMFVYFVSWLWSRGQRTKVGFHMANRTIGEWMAAFSIASSWIWAPALFIATQKSYQEGWVGLFWFTFPNVLCLILFGYFVERLRDKLPKGYTLPEFMRQRYSERTHSAYLFQNVGLLICCLAVQMLAGGKVISKITGLPFEYVAPALALIAITYTLAFGLRASVVTDWLKMILVFALIGVLVPWAVTNAGGWGVVVAGLNGKSGEYTSLFTGKGGTVFWSFGLAAFIGLMSGPFGDQSFYQRAWCVHKDKVRGAFIKGAFIFALVPLSMSVLGFLAAGAGMNVKEVGFTNLAVIQGYLPAAASLMFIFLIMSALTSTMDSHMTAMASLGGHDFVKRILQLDRLPNRDEDITTAVEDKESIRFGRISIIIITLLGAGLAMAPGMQILYLFLFYGTLRASTLLPTVLTVMLPQGYLEESGVFWGVVLAMLIGLPIFAYGNFTKNVPMIVAGSLLTIILSGGLSLVVTWVRRRGAVTEAA